MARLIEVDLGAVEKKFYNDLAAHYHDSYGRGFTAGLKAMFGFLKEQPTIEPKQEWISVKDRLPEKGKSVLVYWDDGFDIGEYVGGEVGDDVYWMPLPEPPEREGE